MCFEPNASSITNFRLLPLWKTKRTMAYRIETKKSEIVQIPNSSVDLNDSESSKLLKLLSDLEDLDDVTKVFSSANFSEKSIEEFALG